MNQRLQEQLDEQEVKINQIYVSVKKTERYLRLTFWITIGIVVLPLVAAIFIIPAFIRSFTSSLEGLI